MTPSSPIATTAQAPQWTIQDLDALLSQQEWQAADQVTLALLLERANRTTEGWLDDITIAQLPCDALHDLDQHWVRYSSGQFGFSVQQRIYTEMVQADAFAFSGQVGWTISPYRCLGFYKFYDFLNFSLDAPPGHLPARWFWRIPWHHSLRMGGFGTGRGAAFGDANMLDAMMLRLERCQQV